MRKLHLYIFQFFILFFALLSKNLAHTSFTLSIGKNLYWDILKGFKINVEFSNILRDSSVRFFIDSYITSELFKCYLNNRSYNKYDLIDHLERKIINDYFAKINREYTDRYELRRFLERLILDKERSVIDFMEHFSYNTYNIKEKYNSLLKKFYNESSEIEKLYMDALSASKEINSSLYKYDELESESDYNYYTEKNKSKFYSLKNLLSELRNKITTLNNLNYKVKQLQGDIKSNIFKYESSSYDSMDTRILDQLKDISFMSVFDLENKITEAKYDLKKKIGILDNKVSKISNGIGIEERNVKLYDFSDVKDTILTEEEVRKEYEEYIKSIESNSESDSGRMYDNFEKLLMLLEKHKYWLEHQNPFSYCQRKDILQVLNVSLQISEKLLNYFNQASDHLVKLYENLFDEINKYLYKEDYDTNANVYNLCWDEIQNFRTSDFLMASNRFSHAIFILQKRIRLFKSKNNHLEGEQISNLDRIINSLQNIKTSLKLRKSEFVKLVHSPENMSTLRSNIGYRIDLFREKFLNLKSNMNSFEAATGQLHSEVDNVLNVVSNIIYHDNLVDDFENMRKLWKAYVKNNYGYYNNDNRLTKAYEENKNIIFPPDFDLTKSSEVSENINKNVLSSSYFNILYNNVISRFDSLKSQSERIKLFSTVYRSVDSIIDLIKENRKVLRSKYKKIRKDILEMIEIRNYSKKNGQSYHRDLIEHEKSLVNNLQKLFLNKINLHKHLENSVELVKNNLYKNNLPSYCNAVEEFITKYFITISKWKEFINENKRIIPSNIIYKIESV